LNPAARKSGPAASAIQTAKQHSARLLIAKLDRLSRNASFVMVLRDSEVDFVACDLPDANTLTIGIMASFAQHEAEQMPNGPEPHWPKRRLVALP
jgi:DNA invertase Pin-like site-specific DNA recombinase